MVVVIKGGKIGLGGCSVAVCYSGHGSGGEEHCSYVVAREGRWGMAPMVWR